MMNCLKEMDSIGISETFDISVYQDEITQIRDSILNLKKRISSDHDSFKDSKIKQLKSTLESQKLEIIRSFDDIFNIGLSDIISAQEPITPYIEPSQDENKPSDDYEGCKLCPKGTRQCYYDCPEEINDNEETALAQQIESTPDILTDPIEYPEEIQDEIIDEIVYQDIQEQPFVDDDDGFEFVDKTEIKQEPETSENETGSIQEVTLNNDDNIQPEEPKNQVDTGNWIHFKAAKELKRFLSVVMKDRSKTGDIHIKTNGNKITFDNQYEIEADSVSNSVDVTVDYKAFRDIICGVSIDGKKVECIKNNDGIYLEFETSLCQRKYEMKWDSQKREQVIDKIIEPVMTPFLSINGTWKLYIKDNPVYDEKERFIPTGDFQAIVYQDKLAAISERLLMTVMKDQRDLRERPALGCVYFNGTHAFTSNGQTATYIETDCMHLNGIEEICIDPESIKKMVAYKADEFTFEVYKNKIPTELKKNKHSKIYSLIFLSAGSDKVAFDGYGYDDFPDFSRIIEENFSYDISNPKGFNVDKKELLRTVKQAKKLAGSKTPYAKLDLENGVLRIDSQNCNMGESKIEMLVNSNGDRWLCGMNLSYLVNALSKCKGDTIRVNCGTVKPDDSYGDPFVIDDFENNHQTLIMPMRLS